MTRHKNEFNFIFLKIKVLISFNVTSYTLMINFIKTLIILLNDKTNKL